MPFQGVDGLLTITCRIAAGWILSPSQGFVKKGIFDPAVALRLTAGYTHLAPCGVKIQY
ncbi:MAG: hypothetical protein LBU34_13650 [Planctomycetaceae bacterium]|jgi:hypothetical protein|nr:hypothetical protein [Planctomycetaceae bacterium]